MPNVSSFDEVNVSTFGEAKDTNKILICRASFS